MLRLSKFLMIALVLIFLLACNFVTQPLQDAGNLAATAQSLGSAVPVETLQALPTIFPTLVPAETLQALPSAIPTLEALATNMPDLGNILDPQGSPVPEWKGIPIMSQAIAGQEFPESNMYSFRANVTAQEVQDFYNEKLTSLGWAQPFTVPNEQQGVAMMLYQKDGKALTIMVMVEENGVVANLTLV